MPKLIDLIGKKIGRLTIHARAKSHHTRGVRWHCLCDCGTNIIACSADLQNGDTKSCGCLKRHLIINRNTSHGMYGSPEYITWAAIRSRCTNPMVSGYKNYGGRGISMCERWLNSFDNFYSDMGARPDCTSIDRIDNDGNYESSNCRWATRNQQARNKRIYRNNTSGSVGVNFRNRRLPWIASIRVDNKRIHLGAFHTKEQAITARLEGEVTYW